MNAIKIPGDGWAEGTTEFRLSNAAKGEIIALRRLIPELDTPVRVKLQSWCNRMDNVPLEGGIPLDKLEELYQLTRSNPEIQQIIGASSKSFNEYLDNKNQRLISTLPAAPESAITEIAQNTKEAVRPQQPASIVPISRRAIYESRLPSKEKEAS
jgi:hypothetical protein